MLQEGTLCSIRMDGNVSMLNGLGFVNLELSSKCNKGDGTLGSGCPMCGRRKLERDFPDLVNWGNMEFELVKEIAKQIPSGIVTQFHFNGESLLHPQFGECVSLFSHTIRCMDTNGKLLLEKAEEIIGNLETLTISVVQDDPEQEKQYEIVRLFNERKGNRAPRMVYRFLGRIRGETAKLYAENFPGRICRRVLHSPMGSFSYERNPTIPEIGICLDLLTHLAIDRFGKVSHCVRFDPHGYGVLGNVSEGLENIWNGNLRRVIIEKHLRGERGEIPLCGRCEYFGVPRGE